MAYNQNKKNLGGSTQGLTLWLKHKIIKKKNGEEKEVFQSSVDIGGGKMVKISIDARLYTIDSKDGHLLPVYVSKWKTNSTTTNTQKSSW